MVRNSLKYVSCKDYKAVTVDLKNIYKSVTAEEAYMEQIRFADKWDNEYRLSAECGVTSGKIYLVCLFL